MVELKGSEKQVKWANNIRNELNRFLDIIKETNVKRLELKGKDSNKMIKNMKNIYEKLNSIQDSKFFIQNLSELTDRRISESDKICCIGQLSNKAEEFKRLSVYTRHTAPIVKQYVENTDEIIATNIKAKNMEKGKFYRIEKTVTIPGSYMNSLQKIYKGTILALLNENNEVVFNGYIQTTDSNSNEFKYSRKCVIRYNRKEIHELDLVEINYKGKIRDLIVFD